MLPHRVGFSRRFGLKTGIHFAHFGLESGVVFKGTTQYMNVFITTRIGVTTFLLMKILILTTVLLSLHWECSKQCNFEGFFHIIFTGEVYKLIITQKNLYQAQQPSPREPRNHQTLTWTILMMSLFLATETTRISQYWLELLVLQMLWLETKTMKVRMQKSQKTLLIAVTL